MKEAKGLGPGDRVLVVGNSREPQLCVKKDEKAFMGFWTKHIFLPAPDYASRKVCAGGRWAGWLRMYAVCCVCVLGALHACWFDNYLGMRHADVAFHVRAGVLGAAQPA